MGLVYTNIRLSNPVKPGLLAVDVTCLVDSGSTFLCIPQHIANQLDLKEEQRREITLADDTSKMVPYVGPIKIEFENRICFVGAMVLGDTCLLGAVPTEDMDVVIHRRYFKLTVNPESPNVARGLVKQP